MGTARRWLQRNGEADQAGKLTVPWTSVSGVPSAMPPTLPTDEEMYDVYNSHVKHCTHCQGALR